jgi:trk system potassium uptake protein TrkH
MRWRFILRTIGVLIFFFGLTMILPLTVGFYYRDQSLPALLLSMGITVIAGLILYLIFRKAQAEVIRPPSVCSGPFLFIWEMDVSRS